MDLQKQPILRYLSHPQVHIDPTIPVPEWGLSELGKTRTELIKNSRLLAKTTSIVCSTETKANETANIIASQLRLPVDIRKNLTENDRSSTGFLNPDEFEETATRFFENPKISIRGWERAIDAQSRIVGEVNKLINNHVDGDILVIGHGGVGTLLYCHFAKMPISRKWDQPAGGGNFFSINIDKCNVLHHWLPMEKLTV